MVNLKGIRIGSDFPCYIVAEVGQNHQGDVNLAKQLIMEAKVCGADCVKFQKSSLAHKFTKSALQSPYNSPNSFGSTYGEHKAYLEFSDTEFKELRSYAAQVGIDFSASAMDQESAIFLLGLNLPYLKIGSGDTNNYPLLEYLAKNATLPLIVSTGMQCQATIDTVVKILSSHSNYALLHCVSAYPTSYEDVHLGLIDVFRKKYPNVVIGYSGHEKGINIAIAAVVKGAKVIEKHFTLNNNLKGTDHQCSLNPVDFKMMVKGIREVEAALGIGKPRILEREFLKCEIECKEKLGKSLVAVRNLPKGKKIVPEDMFVKVSRPRGLSPEKIYNCIGKVLQNDVEQDMPFMEHHIFTS